MPKFATETTDLPQGQGMGIAIVEDHGSICAACATVRVSQAGELAVATELAGTRGGHSTRVCGTPRITGAGGSYYRNSTSSQ